MNQKRIIFSLVLLLIPYFGFSQSQNKIDEKKRPKVDPLNIRAMGIPAHIPKRAQFDEIITQSKHHKLNTFIVTFKDVDPRGDREILVPITNYKKDASGKKIQTVTKKKKWVIKHLPNVYFKTSNPLAIKADATRNMIESIPALQKKLWSNNIELGARFCLFADYKLSEYLRATKAIKKNTMVIKSPNQSVWTAHLTNGQTKFPMTITNLANNKVVDPFFVDPLNPVVVDYNIALLKELYDYGIRFFILDYVRMEDPTDTKIYSPKIFYFNHLALEQALRKIISEMNDYSKVNRTGPELLLSVSVFGRVLFKTYNGTMDPVGQNINTFHTLGYKISSMDYTHLLLKEYRQQPYEGRKLYLKYGMEKIPKEAFIPWVDVSAKSAPENEKVTYVYKELRAVIDSGINSYIFWIPSGHPLEYERVFAALAKNRQITK